MTFQPEKLPEWASAPSSGGDIVEPPSIKKQDGWNANEEPPAGYFNWWQNLTYRWLQMFDAMLWRNWFRIKAPADITLRVTSFDMRVVEEPSYPSPRFFFCLNAMDGFNTAPRLLSGADDEGVEGTVVTVGSVATSDRYDDVISLGGGVVLVSMYDASASKSIIYRSTNGGGIWSATAGEFAVSNRIKFVRGFEDNSLIYAYTCDGGTRVLRSSDYGATWTATTLGGPIYSLFANADEAYTLWINNVGSINKGDSAFGSATTRLALSLTTAEWNLFGDLPGSNYPGGSASRVFAALGVGGIYRSMDQGDTWTQVSTANCTQGIVIGNTVLAFNANSLYRSLDGGATWAWYSSIGIGENVGGLFSGKLIKYLDGAFWATGNNVASFIRTLKF